MSPFTVQEGNFFKLQMSALTETADLQEVLSLFTKTAVSFRKMEHTIKQLR